ncbi:MAG TPA: carbamoyltransferase N-terminal domain-containing protein, partial [Vicinamibacterales bacterium]
MKVLGLNAFHADSAAALLEDGAFVTGVEEERLNRVKHWAGFPEQAIRAVLQDGGTALDEVEHVAISRDPKAHFVDKALFALRHRVRPSTVRSRIANLRHVSGTGAHLEAILGNGLRARVHQVEHHRAHLASAFFCSPFEEAACLTVDGFGDFVSSMSAVGRGATLTPIDEVTFPHSLGILYTAVTQFLGFPHYGDEYKVMGLASYGRPEQLPELRRLAQPATDGRFELDTRFFRHASDGVTMTWPGGAPEIGPLWSDRLRELLGPAREPGTDLTERHQNIAASLQALYEAILLHRLRWLQKRTGLTKLCLAGGCALNSVANGRILTETGFTDVFIQSAAGDAGTALGAALWVWHQELGHPRRFVMEHSYWGPQFAESRVIASLASRLAGFDRTSTDQQCGEIHLTRDDCEERLCRDTARAIADGHIVGWYQGRGEWGPRALGNRSILADPRRPEMKDVLNARIKRREPFRPFAPSILAERVGDYFEQSHLDPFMVTVYPIRAERRAEIPAVTHVDGTGRL